jgi:hypothetical protein
MVTDPVPGRKTFQIAIMMSALWLGANTLIVWKAYQVETAGKPATESSSFVAEVHARADLDSLLLSRAG